MTKSFNTLLALFVMAISSGCQKNTPNYLDGTYKTGKILQLDIPKMYTKTSVITDMQMINAFLDRNKSPSEDRDSGFIFDRTTEAFDMKMQFDLNGDNATVTYNAFSTYSDQKKLRRKNEEQLVLEPLNVETLTFSETNRSRLFSMSYYMEANNTGDFVYNFDAPNYVVKTKKNETLLQSDARLIMPVVRYVFKYVGTKQESGATMIHPSNSWHYFNPNIADHLLPGDTLVVQSKTAELIKQ